MPVDAEKEINKIHRTLHSTQNEIGKTLLPLATGCH